MPRGRKVGRAGAGAVHLLSPDTKLCPPVGCSTPHRTVLSHPDSTSHVTTNLPHLRVVEELRVLVLLGGAPARAAVHRLMHLGRTEGTRKGNLSDTQPSCIGQSAQQYQAAVHVRRARTSAARPCHAAKSHYASSRSAQPHPRLQAKRLNDARAAAQRLPIGHLNGLLVDAQQHLRSVIHLAWGCGGGRGRGGQGEGAGGGGAEGVMRKKA